ncbi:protein kinase C epsilon type-like [Hyla sarda]|uniref:protein kinase C epsilon type-like n=1 Tax=Hyla sarda TaxID=327740 RepID=UPI0024C316C6|nr:protein kinase C epsilon type-like [Hyla sarda]
MMSTLQCIWMHRSLDHWQQVPPDVSMTTRHLDNGCCCLPTTHSWTERTDVYRIPEIAASRGRGDGEKEKMKREEEQMESGQKREEERKSEEESEEVEKREEERKSEEEVEKKGEKRKREEEEEKREEKRKREEGSEEVEKTGQKRKREEESEEEEKREEKRKKVEESEEVEKKRRGEDARVLEDEEPRPGTSQDPGTSSNYPKFNITHLTVHQVLGKGSFGVVGLASVPGRNNYVAIKGITKTANNAATLQRERRILMLARDCPFLCHLYAAQQSQDNAFFITEYLSGGSLEALLRMCSSLNTDTVRFYTAEIACGLQFLHRQNIVHRPEYRPDEALTCEKRLLLPAVPLPPTLSLSCNYYRHQAR